MPAAWHDLRIARGMKEQLANRRAGIAAGETEIAYDLDPIGSVSVRLTR